MHEQPPPKKELPHEQQSPVFDLEQLEPQHVVALVEMLGGVLGFGGRSRRDICSHDEVVSALHGMLEQNIASLPAHNPEKALNLYLAMAETEKTWPRAVVAANMPNMLRALPTYSTGRAALIDSWIELTRDLDPYVSEFAADTMSEVVRSAWLDEPTAQYLNTVLPVELRRESD